MDFLWLQSKSHVNGIWDKAHSLAAYQNLEFGNRGASWPSLDAYILDLQHGHVSPDLPIALRTANVPGLKLPNYCMELPLVEIERTHMQWQGLGIPDSAISVYEALNGPSRRLLLQGEVTRVDHAPGFYIRGSRDQGIMRYAWEKDEIHLQGLRAWLTLKTLMDAPSWDQLQTLFDTWPDSAVELSIFEQPCGVLGWNTVFWEVRNY